MKYYIAKYLLCSGTSWDSRLECKLIKANNEQEVKDIIYKEYARPLDSVDGLKIKELTYVDPDVDIENNDLSILDFIKKFPGVKVEKSYNSHFSITNIEIHNVTVKVPNFYASRDYREVRLGVYKKDGKILYTSGYHSNMTLSEAKKIMLQEIISNYEVRE